MPNSKLLVRAALLTTILIVVLGSVLSTLAAPAEVQVPFKGTLQGTESHVINFPYMSLDASGTGNATLFGAFTFHYTGVVDLRTSTGTGLSMEIIAANGDRLYAEGHGLARPTADISYVTEWYTITGGTGRFADATGSFTLTRQVNRVSGALEGSFDGTLVLAAGQ